MDSTALRDEKKVISELAMQQCDEPLHSSAS